MIPSGRLLDKLYNFTLVSGYARIEGILEKTWMWVQNAPPRHRARNVSDVLRSLAHQDAPKLILARLLMGILQWSWSNDNAIPVGLLLLLCEEKSLPVSVPRSKECSPSRNHVSLRYRAIQGAFCTFTTTVPLGRNDETDHNESIYKLFISLRKWILVFPQSYAALLGRTSAILELIATL